MPSSDDPLGLRNSLRMPKPKMSMSLSSGRKKSQPDQEPDPSFLRSLGHAGLGLAGAVGNTLDLPGSMVRDTLAGQNPFDQLLSPMSDQNRVSGRDLIRKYGLAGKEDTWGNFFGGLGAEIATDPFVLTGLKPLGNTAKGLSQIKAGTKGASTLAGGIARGERALATGKIPFTKIDWALGTGPKAVKAGQKLDQAYNAVRYSKPGRVVAGLFSAPAGSNATKRGQQLAAKVYAQEQRDRVIEKSNQIQSASHAQREGITDNDAMRKLLEQPVPPEMRGAEVARIHDSKDKLFRKRRSMGQAVGGGIEDPYVLHVPRYSDKSISGFEDFGNAPKMGLSSKKDSARAWIFKAFKEGTPGTNALLSDPRWEKMLREAQASGATWGDTKQKVLDELNRMNAGETIFDAKHKSIVVRQAPKTKTRGVADLTKMKAIVAKKYGKAVAENIKWDDLADKTAGKADVKFMLKQRVRDRAEGLADYIMKRPDTKLGNDLYQNNPLIDVYNYNLNARRKIAAHHYLNEDLFRNTLPEAVTSQQGTWKNTGKTIKLPKRADRSYEIAKEGEMTVGGLFRQLKIDPRKAMTRLLVKKGIEPNADNVFASLKSSIPADVAKDFMAVYSKGRKTPVEGEIGKLMRNVNQTWKAFALAHPATKIRDRISGWVQGMLHGVDSGIPFVNSTGKKATDVYLGRSVQGLQEIPAIQKWVAEQGLPLNDQTATDALRHLYASNLPGSVNKTSDVAGSHVVSDSPTLSSILAHVPGYQPSTIWGNIKKTAKTLAGREGDATWNPFKTTIRGVGDATETNHALLKAADMASGYTDTANRLGPFMKLVDEGWDPFAAMQKVNDIQVDYSPHTFTDFEKKIKQYMPFYGFTSKMTKHTAKELASNPGGRLAQAVRLQSSLHDRSGTTPEHIDQTAAIPLGQTEDGTRRYITGLGLMHEPALAWMQPDPQQLLLQGLSQTAPYIQQPLQYATGQSFFQREADTGRPLAEMDPNIGRIMANITGQKDAIRYPGDQIVESLVGASPLVRAVPTVRQLTDPRKDVFSKALGFGTGIKFSDVSPQAQERTLRKKVEAAAKQLGGRTSTSVYFPQDLVGNEQVNRYKDLLRHLGKKSRKRSKTKKKAAPK